MNKLSGRAISFESIRLRLKKRGEKLFFQVCPMKYVIFKLSTHRMSYVGATQADEEFSWEDEEEEAITPGKETVVPRPSNETLTAEKATTVPSENNVDFLSVTPASTSPRDSSESSYDVVSSGHLSETVIPTDRADSHKREDEDADSDW